MLVLSFYYAILLWCIGASELMVYLIVLKILGELVSCTLSFIVCSWAINLLPYFSFGFVSEFLKLWKVLNFSFIKNTQIYLEKPSMNVTIYCMPLIKRYLIDPNTLKCISFNGSFTLNSDFSYGSWWVMPCLHPGHSIVNLNMLIIFILMITKFKCVWLKC